MHVLKHSDSQPGLQGPQTIHFFAPSQLPDSGPVPPAIGSRVIVILYQLHGYKGRIDGLNTTSSKITSVKFTSVYALLFYTCF